MRIWPNFASREGSETVSNFRKAEVRAEYGKRKRSSGYESEIKNRAEWIRKGEKGQEGWRAMEDKENGDDSLFSHQIVDFTFAPAPVEPVPSCSFLHFSLIYSNQKLYLETYNNSIFYHYILHNLTS